MHSAYKKNNTFFKRWLQFHVYHSIHMIFRPLLLNILDIYEKTVITFQREQHPS